MNFLKMNLDWVDTMPDVERYKYFHIRKDEAGELHYTLKDSVLSDRLKQVRYPKQLNQLSIRERNAVEDECWTLLQRKFG